MGRSTKDVWAADAAGTLLLFEPEKLTLVTDQAHPLYDPRVHLPADEALVRSIMRKGVLQPISCIRDNETAAAAGAAGHAKARKQREAVAEATGANTKPASRGKREIRAAMEAAPAGSATRAVLAWVLGEAQELPG